MERIYNSGKSNNSSFFIGHEVEKTPAHGLLTLFVVGIQNLGDILYHYKNHPDGIEHIFFGANHSFNPQTAREWEDWEEMIASCLKENILCSLDIPVQHVEEFNEGSLNEYSNFIPQIRVPIPYIQQWNYNTTIKIDDRGFNVTNPGVWCHSLHDLKNRKFFTDWQQYNNDEIIE